jgi:hypothetical protein
MADFSVLAADSYIDQQEAFAQPTEIGIASQGFNCRPSLSAPEQCS